MTVSSPGGHGLGMKLCLVTLGAFAAGLALVACGSDLPNEAQDAAVPDATKPKDAGSDGLDARDALADVASKPDVGAYDGAVPWFGGTDCLPPCAADQGCYLGKWSSGDWNADPDSGTLPSPGCQPIPPACAQAPTCACVVPYYEQTCPVPGFVTCDDDAGLRVVCTVVNP
ncbi:MAG TPA: hypothetical protein VF316_15540 [Polyangiaceae bacterium]